MANAIRGIIADQAQVIANHAPVTMNTCGNCGGTGHEASVCASAIFTSHDGNEPDEDGDGEWWQDESGDWHNGEGEAEETWQEREPETLREGEPGTLQEGALETWQEGAPETLQEGEPDM
jgi:hypothetical protein